MKCALHIHTTFSDGMHSPEEMIAAYREEGFQCVAITDHGFMIPSSYYNYLELLGGRLKGTMMVLAGVENDCAVWNNHHLLEINGNQDRLRVLAHPRAYYLTPEEIKVRAKNAPAPIDAIETSHRGFYTPEYDVEAIDLPKIGTDDSHELYDVARCWIETDYTSDPDQLFRAIRAGQFSIKMA